MNKSIYSLLLMDKVIEQIDRMAYEANTSRSALVNRILADHVCCTTPEQRMQSIFEQIQSIFEQMPSLFDGLHTFHMLPSPSEAMLAMRTALSFKYSPSIRYSVELYRSLRPAAGILRVAARTQSEALLYELSCFFDVWMLQEKKSGIGENNSAFSGGHYAREIYLSEDHTDQEAADAIADYIRVLDRAIKTYFELLPQREHAIASVRELYERAFLEGRINV